MASSASIPSISSIFELLKQIADAEARLKAILTAFDSFGSTPDEIIKNIESKILSGEIDGLSDILDEATSLFNLLNLLNFSGLNPESNTITVKLDKDQSTLAKTFTSRIAGLRDLFTMAAKNLANKITHTDTPATSTETPEEAEEKEDPKA